MGLFGSGGGGQVSGYNEKNIGELRGTINSIAGQIGDAVVTELHNGVITPMSTAWYAEEAKEYFKSFAEAVAKTGVDIKELFDNFIDQINKTGHAWAQTTGAPDFADLAKVDKIELSLTYDEIKEADENGNRALDEAAVERVVSSLEGIEQNIKSQLSSIAQGLDADTSFLGHGQSEAVEGFFVKISESVHKIFQMLLTGDTSLSEALTAFKTKYATSAEEVASAYNSSEVEIKSN